MKFTLKNILIILVVLILLFAIPALIGICPPPGPWPMPPWCDKNGNGLFGTKQITSTETQTTKFTPTPTQNVKSTPNPKETPRIDIQPTPTAKKIELIDANITLTVPYWTKGDIYLSTKDNSKFLKLTKVNQVIYTGKIKIAKDSEYYYTSDDGKDIDNTRKIQTNRINDYVLDWDGLTHEVLSEDFQKNMFISACHFCSVSITKGNFIEPFSRAMDNIKENGGNWINLVPVWFVDPDYTGNEIKPIYSEDFKGNSGWITSTIKDEDLIKLITLAHSKGLKVYLVPHLAVENWGPGIKAKGDLDAKDPNLFFENYKKFQTHYAKIAEENSVEMYSVGNEMDSSAHIDGKLAQRGVDVTAKWKDVIKTVRENYKGQVGYSVSCMSEPICGPDKVGFWDALDFIGWEWYVPIAKEAHEPIENMKTNAERIVNNQIKPLSEKYNKPVIITEIGWEAYAGACAHTYGVGPSTGGDRIEQASCYEAVFQAIEGKPFIKGIVVWMYSAGLPGDTFEYVNKDSVNEIRASITEKEIYKWYKK